MLLPCFFKISRYSPQKHLRIVHTIAMISLPTQGSNTMTAIKFNTLKTKAKKQLGYTAKSRAALTGNQAGWLNDTAFKALLHLAIDRAQFRQQERPALAAFAKAHNGNQNDVLSGAAKQMAERTIMVGNAAQELALLALKAREEAIDMIDRWDARCAGQLIDLFPDIVSKKNQLAHLHLYIADNANSDWMIEFHPSVKRPPSVTLST